MQPYMTLQNPLILHTVQNPVQLYAPIITFLIGCGSPTQPIRPYLLGDQRDKTQFNFKWHAAI